MNDELDDHEGRRNALLVMALVVVGIGMVAAMFWVVKSMPGPDLVVTAASTPSPTTTAAPVATTAAPPTSTTTFVPPTASWTDTATLNLPPPEQPTVTDPVSGQTPDPDPNAPVPVTAPPTSAVANPPPGPSVTNVNLTCSKNGGGKVVAKLSFTTTTKINVAISAGGQVDRKEVGPGNQSMATSGRGAGLCAAVVGGQAVGPIPAS